MGRITFFCLIIVLGITTAAMAAPVDLNIDGMMFGLGHPVPTDDTWNHQFNMPLKNGELQGSPGWTTVGTDVLASKETGIIGGDFGFFGPFGTMTVGFAPSIDLTNDTLTLGLLGWKWFWNGFLFTGGRDSSYIATTYDSNTNRWTADWSRPLVPGEPLFQPTSTYWHLEGTVAVPEPGSMILFGSGLAGLLGLARRMGR